MTRSFPKLEMEKVLQSDAREIIGARERGRLINKTRDIDSSGNEIEQVVRRILRKKLSQIYHVGHGHVVDSNGKTSRQLDIIVADNVGAPLLFEAEDGTQYFPYESVYAIGEVKTSYRKSERPVHTFTDNLRALKSTLQRETVQSLSSVGEIVSPNMLPEDTYGRSNPIFTFMLFVEANDFSVEDVRELYSTSKATDLPNALCFLDKGVVLFKKEGSDATRDWSFYSVHPGLSEEMNLTLQSRQSGNWYFIQFGSAENRCGANFGFLYSLICSFLGRCTLQSPDMAKYMEQIFTISYSEEIAKDRVPPLKFF